MYQYITVHLIDQDKIHGIACNSENNNNNVFSTDNKNKVSCKKCMKIIELMH